MRKNIYVKNEDAAVFDRAKALFGGNISAVVAEILREKVEAAEAAAAGHEDIVLKVGDLDESPESLRFRGKLLRDCIYSRARWELYLTAEGKFVVWRNQGDYASCETYDTVMDLLAAKLPDELLYE